MTVPHANLRVNLLIERPVAADAVDEATQEAAATALNHALKGATRRSVPHLDRVFIVDQQPLSLSIDYVPDQKVHCGEPPDLLF
jgi:DNA-binding GntR family transcriptional regulator